MENDYIVTFFEGNEWSGTHLLLNHDPHRKGIQCASTTSVPASTPELYRSEVVASLPQNSSKKMYMGVSKNRGIPKWMVYNGKPY